MNIPTLTPNSCGRVTFSLLSFIKDLLDARSCPRSFICTISLHLYTSLGKGKIFFTVLQDGKLGMRVTDAPKIFCLIGDRTVLWAQILWTSKLLITQWYSLGRREMKRERTAVSRNASWATLCYIDANYLTTDRIQYGYSLWQNNFNCLPNTIHRRLLNKRP